MRQRHSVEQPLGFTTNEPLASSLEKKGQKNKRNKGEQKGEHKRNKERRGKKIKNKEKREKHKRVKKKARDPHSIQSIN